MSKPAGGTNGGELPIATWNYMIEQKRPVIYHERWWTVSEAEDTGKDVYLRIVATDGDDSQVVKRGDVELVSMGSWKEWLKGVAAASTAKPAKPAKRLPSPDDPHNDEIGPPFKKFSSFPIGDEMGYKRRTGRGVTTVDGGTLGVVVTSGRSYMTVLTKTGKVFHRANPSEWYRVSARVLDANWPKRFTSNRDPLLGVIVEYRGRWYFVKDIRDNGRKVNLVLLSGRNTGSDQWIRNVPWSSCVPIPEYSIKTYEGEVTP